jgi:hypothetical protein
MNKFLLTAALAAVLSACPGVRALPGTPVPSELQGEWTYGTISSVQYYNPNNGHWGQVNGAGDRFRLEPNGNYERSRLIQISTYGCESNLFIWEVGTVRLENNAMTFQPADGAVKGQSCSAANSYEKRGPGSVKSETWKLELQVNEFNQDVLVLTQGEAKAHYGRLQ